MAEKMLRRNSLVFRRLAKSMHQMLRSHCERTGDTEADVAEALSIDRGYLNNMANGHAAIPADVLVGVTRALRDVTAMEAACHLCGLVCITAPDAEVLTRSTSEVLARAADAARESGEAIQRVLMALQDGRIDQDEFAECESKIREAIVTFDRLLRVASAAVQRRLDEAAQF